MGGVDFLHFSRFIFLYRFCECRCSGAAVTASAGRLPAADAIRPAAGIGAARRHRAAVAAHVTAYFGPAPLRGVTAAPAAIACTAMQLVRGVGRGHTITACRAAAEPPVIKK